MHVDHLVFAAGPDGLKAEVERLGERLGAKFKDGGFHPRFGTRNNILPLSQGRYLEVVEVLDHPAAEKAVYGQAVRARSELGGGWMGWVVRVDDLSPIEERLGRSAVDGMRHFPDGRLLEWKQIGIKGLMADPQLPYFLKWESAPELLPSALQGEIGLEKLEISGSRPRVEEWLGQEVGERFDGIEFVFTAPHGMPGIDAVTFTVPGKGEVRI
ncbi:MAG TPA: VOC family protein [Propionibacteriaceae bacterium]|nr:VOC family protein [Propionibacteriaceae bacterium]